jgi:hypothetical protein
VQFLGLDYFTAASTTETPRNKSSSRRLSFAPSGPELPELKDRSSKLVSAPFLMQIGKANRCYNRFLFVCLRLTR